MQKANNYSIITQPGAASVEQDSYTCYHCNKVVFVKPKQKGEDVGGICKLCMQLICPSCTDKGVCDPFEEKLKREEARSKLFASLGR